MLSGPGNFPELVANNTASESSTSAVNSVASSSNEACTIIEIDPTQINTGPEAARILALVIQDMQAHKQPHFSQHKVFSLETANKETSAYKLKYSLIMRLAAHKRICYAEIYDAEENHGEGGFGTVYKSLGKILFVQGLLQLSPSSRVIKTQKKTQVAADEYQIAKTLPYLSAKPITYTSIGVFSCLQRLGTDLKKSCGKILPREIVFSLRKIALNLQSLHQKNIVHGDIKPRNIICKGRVHYLIDMGACKSSSSTHSHSLGTPGYIAPEIVCTKNTTFASDIYSLGITAWRLAGGVRPRAKLVTPFASWIASQSLGDDSPFFINLKKLIAAASHPNPQSRIDLATFIHKLNQLEDALLNEDTPADKCYKEGRQLAREACGESIDWMTLTRRIVSKIAELRQQFDENKSDLLIDHFIQALPVNAFRHTNNISQIMNAVSKLNDISAGLNQLRDALKILNMHSNAAYYTNKIKHLLSNDLASFNFPRIVKQAEKISQLNAEIKAYISTEITNTYLNCLMIYDEKSFDLLLKNVIDAYSRHYFRRQINRIRDGLLSNDYLQFYHAITQYSKLKSQIDLLEANAQRNSQPYMKKTITHKFLWSRSASNHTSPHQAQPSNSTSFRNML